MQIGVVRTCTHTSTSMSHAAMDQGIHERAYLRTGPAVLQPLLLDL